MSNIISIFTYGSFNYKTFTPKSDIDLIAVVNNKNDINLESDIFGIAKEKLGLNNIPADISVYTESEFLVALSTHEISQLECVLIDNSLIYGKPFDIDINKSILRESISKKASNSYVKAKKKLQLGVDFNSYIAKKSLWHSLRILMYGIQIATNGKIENPQIANSHFQDILSMPDDFSVLEEKYKPIYNKLHTEFRTLAPLSQEKMQARLMSRNKKSEIVPQQLQANNHPVQYFLIDKTIRQWDYILKNIPSNDNYDFKKYIDFFPNYMEKLRGCPHDPFYHSEGCVLTHTEMVCHELTKTLEYQNLDDTDRAILFLSALLHDIEKPSTTEITLDGRVSQKNHSPKGAILARFILWQANVPFEVREEICSIILNHQKPFHIFKQSKTSQELEKNIIKLADEVKLYNLYLLAMADNLGRQTNPLSLKNDGMEAIKLFYEAAKEHDLLNKSYNFIDANTKFWFLNNPNITSPLIKNHNEYPFEVVVLSGMPSSGKSTLSESYGLPIISFDDTMEILGLSYGKNNGKVAHMMINNARDLLARKQPFVWDTTNLSRMQRKKTLDLIHKYGAKTKIIYIEKPVDFVFTSNNNRDSSITNDKIVHMLKSWEVPKKSESFSIEYNINQIAKKTLKYK